MKSLIYIILLFCIASCETPNTPTTEVESVILNENNLKLIAGAEFQMQAEILPANALYEGLIWDSSNPEIAVIDEFGKITAIATGETIIIAEAGNTTANCIVNVIDTPLESLILDKTELVMEIGEQQRLNVSSAPENAETGKLLWLSSDINKVTVTQDGNISAHSTGNATITVKAGPISAECNVTITDVMAKNIRLDCSVLEITPKQTHQFIVTAEPEDAPTGEISWTSSNPEIVSIDDFGLAKGEMTGTAEITASVGNITATCFVTVREMGQIMIGDYYYSDGSVSSVFNSEKTPIGVVFWVGDPTKDDPILKKDHPDCTHGLVVALEGDKIRWQDTRLTVISVGEWVSKNRTEYISPLVSPTSNTIKQMLGYNNTKAIEEFNANSTPAVEPVSYIIKFRERVKAPENSSDWYLPSIKEMTLLGCGDIDDFFDKQGLNKDVFDFINSRITKLSALYTISGNPHFSSTEYSLGEAYHIDYAYSTNVYRMSKGMPLNIRAILAI